jgi:hypothetical protein
VGSTGTARGGGTRFVLAAIADLVGLTFIGQGLGLIPGSFMTGDEVWAVVGVVLLAASSLYLALPWLRSR